MKIVFLSNFLNHHQLPLCHAFSAIENCSFHFIATEPVPEDRIALGYVDMNSAYDFVVRTYEDKAQDRLALELSQTADVVIIGSAPDRYTKKRLKEKKLTFRYSERIYKRKPPFYEMPLRIVKNYFRFGRYTSLYLLCASAYTASDFAKTFTFLNKTYKWGYFPEIKRHDGMERLMEAKEPATILWAGRFIDWKHPEYVIEVARRLKEDGYDFQISMIGNGELQEFVGELIKTYALEDRVHLLGAMSPEAVRIYMERAQIFLFTSDRNEGWGAVLNEAMNSACVVIAGDAIGSVPFLLKSKENGLTFQDGNVDDLYEKVKFLLKNPAVCKDLGMKAYETMTGLWNAEVAAQRLIKLTEVMLRGEKYPNLYSDGPCSKAEILKDK